MPGRHRAYTTEHPAKGFKWFPWKREKKVVVEPVQVWSDWVSSEDGTYFYRARKLADGKPLKILPCCTPADFSCRHLGRL